METPPLDIYPLWVVVLDYVLGVIMWTLIGRSAMNIFLREDSDFFFMKFFVRATNPILRIFRPITPGFLLDPMVPLFVAWFFFIIRFYVLPWILGYHVMGMLSFPLESDIARIIYNLAH
ncbi:MAG: YggT family protein [Rhodobiaceae bacterium]|nr:YggT family protein [Rhodobiaceae bacterium]MCC0014074.1 YggT family protein [Rhodobiaceae bacterium]MCC0051664.1 YggT family protein [Rhodobiaceae bacterium]MCC0061972.1 YggT family protein [Rhodobiaceae bacterium]